MKKIIPIISLLGASALVVGASNLTQAKKSENFIHYFNSFQTDAENFSKVDTQMVSTALNKYMLSLDSQLNEDDNKYYPATTYQENTEILSETEILPEIEPITTPTTQEENTDLNSIIDHSTNDVITDNIPTEEIEDKEDNETDEELETRDNISTLYSLSSDITENCDTFCQLKTELHEAIIETQALIEKVNNSEITLTSEQKLLITEQAQQLKNLGRQLSNSTTELSLSVSDLNNIMQSNNQNIDDLSLKYLIVLDNLINGNEMLQSGLTTMRLMNQMFNINSENIPSNNKGRILYGFQQNDNAPVIKDYYIDENNELQENKPETTEQITNEDENTTNVDTYQNSKLQSNIDSYQHSPVNKNIDTFFNTALLDNEFMYGNGNGGMYGYGYGGYAGNPYMNNYANYERGNTNDSVNKDIDTQNKDTNINKNSKRKKLKLTKNIDTYKDENTPNLKSKIENIKSNIGDFFSKFSKSDINDKIDNPVYRYNSNDEEIK